MIKLYTRGAFQAVEILDFEVYKVSIGLWHHKRKKKQPQITYKSLHVAKFL